MVETPEIRLVNLWKKLGAHGDIHTVVGRLLARYAEPHRSYHNLAHIIECLDELDETKRLDELEKKGEKVYQPVLRPLFPSLLELAIWYHDAVYDFGRKDNEQKSAELCLADCQSLGLSLGNEFAPYIHALIMATRHSEPVSGLDSQIMVDLDLMRLGASPEQFVQYSDMIAKEYLSVYTEEEYNNGRKAFLQTMLRRSRLYHTGYFHVKFETQAHINITEGIRRLEKQEKK